MFIKSISVSLVLLSSRHEWPTVFVVAHRREARAGEEEPLRHGHIVFMNESPEMATEVLEKLNGATSSKGFKLHLEYAKRPSTPRYDESQRQSE